MRHPYLEDIPPVRTKHFAVVDSQGMDSLLASEISLSKKGRLSKKIDFHSVVNTHQQAC